MERFLLTILLFGLFIELGTGITLWVIDFWNTTIFSFILLHLLVGWILWIPFLSYVFPHSWGEFRFKYFAFLLPKSRDLVSEERKRVGGPDQQSDTQRQGDRLYNLSAVILLLMLFCSFILGSYLTVVGIPQQRDWVLHTHILSGLVAIGLLVFHLRKPLSQLIRIRLGLMTLFFLPFSEGQPFLKIFLIKRLGFQEYYPPLKINILMLHPKTQRYFN